MSTEKKVLVKLNAVPGLPPHFLSRDEDLKAIKESLLAEADQKVAVTATLNKLGIQGMGGIGKSVLAAAVARDEYIGKAFPDGVYWISIGQVPKITSLQSVLAESLGDGQRVFETEQHGKARLSDLLMNKTCLLILDDIWNPEHSRAFDVLGAKSRILMTTRDARVISALGATEFKLDVLSEPQALTLLAKWTDNRIEAPLPIAKAIAKECGYLPLALALIAAQALDGTSWQDLLDALKEADLEFFDHPSGSILKSIKVSIDALPENEAKVYLKLGAFPEDTPIPEAAILTLWQYTNGITERNARQLVTILSRKALMRADGESPNRFIELHDLQYLYLKNVNKSPKELHNEMLEAYKKKCSDGWASGPNDGYFFTQLRRHLIEAGRASELADLLQELRWLERKNEAGLTFDLPTDFVSAAAAISADDMRRHVLQLLSEAIRTHIHFIAHHAVTYPQSLIQSVVNHLWPIVSEMPLHGRSAAEYQEVARSIKGLCNRWEDETKLRGLAWLKLGWLDRETILGGPLKWQLKMRERQPNVIAFSPTGDMIAGAASWTYSNRHNPPKPWSTGYDLGVWSTDTGALIQQLFPDTTVLALDGPPRNVPRPIHPKIQRVYDDYFARLDSGRSNFIFRSAVSEHWVDALIAGDIQALCWMEDDTLLAGCRGGRVFAWNAQRGQFCGFIQMSNVDAMFEIRNWNETFARSLVGLTPDQFVVGSSFGTIHRFSSHESFHEIQQLGIEPENGYYSNKNQIRSLAFDAVSRRLAVGCLDWVIRVIDVDSWQVLRHLHGHQQDVTGVAWSPDGSRLASVSFDKTLRVWNVDKGCECWPPITHPMDCIAVTWGFDTDQVMTTWNRNGIGGSVRVWSAVDGRLITEFGSVPALYESLAATTNKRFVATGSLDGMIRVWDPSSLGFSFRPRECHEGTVRSAIAHLGRMEIATLGLDGVCVWSIVTGELRGKVERDWSDWVNWSLSVHFSPDGQYLLAVTGNQLNMFDIEQLTLLWSRPSGARDITRCFFSSDSRIFLTDDECAPDAAFVDKGSGYIMWEAKTGECLYRSSGAGLDAWDRFREYEAQVSSAERRSASLEVEWRSYDHWKQDLNTTEVILFDELGRENQLLLSGSFKYKWALTDFGKWIVVLAGGSAPRIMTAQLPNKANQCLE